jgi:hypothetical protein
MRIVLTAAVLGSLLCCSGSEASEAVFDGASDGVPVAVAQPATSSPGTRELVGMLGANGLRPDVTAYIAKAFAGYAKKAEAAAIVAKADQRVLELMAARAIPGPEFINKFLWAAECFADTSDGVHFYREMREIEAATFNTGARLDANAQFSKLLNGMSWASPAVVDPCEAAK